MRIGRQDAGEEAVDLLIGFGELVAVRLLAVRLYGKLADCIHEGVAVEEPVDAAAMGAAGAGALCALEDLDNLQPRQKIRHDLQVLAQQQELVRGHVAAAVLDDWRAIGISERVLGLSEAAHGGAEALHGAVGREQRGELVDGGRGALGAAGTSVKRVLGGDGAVRGLRPVLAPRPLPRSREAPPGVRLVARLRRLGLAFVLVLLELAQGEGRQQRPVRSGALHPGRRRQTGTPVGRLRRVAAGRELREAALSAGSAQRERRPKGVLGVPVEGPLAQPHSALAPPRAAGLAEVPAAEGAEEVPEGRLEVVQHEEHVGVEHVVRVVVLGLLWRGSRHPRDHVRQGGLAVEVRPDGQGSEV
mmetsp:Transcript_40719/g.126918  ORF Transcript_40719/g.126918 Transcript_40719/m.126918 type:complete len:359 (+) Transcript_40719:359-1435(+)